MSHERLRFKFQLGLLLNICHFCTIIEPAETVCMKRTPPCPLAPASKQTGRRDEPFQSCRVANRAKQGLMGKHRSRRNTLGD